MEEDRKTHFVRDARIRKAEMPLIGPQIKDQMFAFAKVAKAEGLDEEAAIAYAEKLLVELVTDARAATRDRLRHGVRYG